MNTIQPLISEADLRRYYSAIAWAIVFMDNFKPHQQQWTMQVAKKLFHFGQASILGKVSREALEALWEQFKNDEEAAISMIKELNK